MDGNLLTAVNADKLQMARAALVGVVGEDNREERENVSLDELERLLDTAGGIAFARVIQARDSIDPATYIGSGKVQELRTLCSENDLSLVVFDCELSPSQIKNLEDGVDPSGAVTVIDRTMLILSIFAQHAVTSEGKLQVELAQLRYTAPRLIGKGLQLSRQQGGAIAMRGPGETKLETDRRHIKTRVRYLEEQLKELEKNRGVQHASRRRSGIFCAAIAGYTNAGKSTLLNYLTGAGVLVEDKLFATLDPTTRRFTLPSGAAMLLTDTVGFIRNLPTKLVEAFKSTLEEVADADAVLLVIDASDPENTEQLAVTKSLLEELGASDKPVIYIYNKCDLVSDKLINVVWNGGSGDAGSGSTAAPRDDVLCVSAKTGQGMSELVARLDRLAADGKSECTFVIPNSDGAALNRLYQIAAVRSVTYGDESVEAVAVCDARSRGMMAKYLKPDK